MVETQRNLSKVTVTIQRIGLAMTTEMQLMREEIACSMRRFAD